MERFNRQIILPEIGTEGQRKLSEASVLVVGLGGLGSPVCQYLTCAGIGRIGLCDNDIVSVSNLNRQTLYSEKDLGLQKSEAAFDRLSEMSSRTHFDVWPDGIDPANARDIISCYDIVVDCCDNHSTRYIIDDVCNDCGIPWVYGSVGKFEARIGTFIPGGIRYSGLFPEREALSSMPPSTEGVVGMLPGLAGTIEASEVVKHICGFGDTLAGKIMRINLKNLIFEIFEL